MNAFAVQAPGSDSQLPKHVDKLRHRIEKRDARIASLESIVGRQMAVIDRYDAAATELSSRVEGGGISARQLSADEYERLIGLLDRAVARAEQLAVDKQALQSNMDNVLGLLDRSLKNQEQLVARAEQPASEQAPAGATTPGQSLASTVSQYDAMLERSLAALENTRQANEAQKREIDHLLGLLDRSLKNQEQLIDRSGHQLRRDDAQDTPPDGKTVDETVNRYDSMLERSLAALENARQMNATHRHDTELRDRYINQTLDALQSAIQMQERFVERYQSERPPADPVSAPASTNTDAMEATLARYDAILDQALSVLERAHEGNNERKREIEQRDRLLSRTLDTLQVLVEEEAAADTPRQGVWARLFR